MCFALFADLPTVVHMGWNNQELEPKLHSNPNQFKIKRP
jgi:hypothetical protein